ncbi:MAG: hypothetical protein EZS28_038411, partial [Streblomastix strix]
MGFQITEAYKVEAIDGNILLLGIPEIEEVYDEFEVSSTFSAIYEPQYIQFANDEEIMEELRKSNFVNSIYRKSQSKLIPVIKFTFELILEGVKVNYSLTFPEFMKGVTFVVKGELTIKYELRVDISLADRTMFLNTISRFSNKYSFVLTFSVGTPEKGITKDLTDRLKNKLAENDIDKDFAFSLIKVFIRTFIPLVNFEFRAEFVLVFSLKVELKITVEDVYTTEEGFRLTSDGLESFRNSDSYSQKTDFEICGTILLKVGVRITFKGVACLIFEAAFKYEIGLYFKITGVAKAKVLSDLYGTEDGHESGALLDLDSYCVALYAELGIYMEMSVTGTINLIILKLESKKVLLAVDIPLLSIGFTQYIELLPTQRALVFSSDGVCTLPVINVNVIDMLTNKTENKQVEKNSLIDVFDVISSSSNFYLDNSDKYNPLLRLKPEHSFNFSDKLTLPMKKEKGWRNFFPKLDLSELSVKITGKRGLIHYELGTLNANTVLDISFVPILIESLSAQYEAVVQDPEYAILHPDLNASELIYNKQTTSSEMEDFQIGRLVHVIPNYFPSNIKITSFIYQIEKGAEFIVGGVSGLILSESEGITHAYFRIKEEANAIGNYLTILDWSKEIKIKITSNQEEHNISSSNVRGILASPIPMLDFDFQ